MLQMQSALPQLPLDLLQSEDAPLRIESALVRIELVLGRIELGI
jgi:hypothetical protein